jgi:hypothetical protein
MYGRKGGSVGEEEEEEEAHVEAQGMGVETGDV